LLTDVVKHDTTLNRIRLNGTVRQILRDPGKLEKPIVVQCSKFLGVALPLFPRQTTAAGSGVLSRCPVTLIPLAHATFDMAGTTTMHFANYIVLGLLIACMLSTAAAVILRR
jgi:hypothetical protein